MKYLILILISFSAFGENWMPHSKILEGSISAHQLKASCEAISGEECFDVADYPSSVYSEKIQKYEVQSCETEDECQEFLELKSCKDAIKNLDLMEVYCTKKIIVLDEIKVSAYEQSLLDIEIKKQKEIAIQQSLKSMECGKRVIAQISVANDLRQLPIDQVIQQSSIYNPIATLLERGALKSAKASIAQIVADGTIVREEDKALAIQAIEECDPIQGE